MNIKKEIEKVVLEIVTETWSWGANGIIMDQSDPRITKAIKTLQAKYEDEQEGLGVILPIVFGIGVIIGLMI